MKKIRNKEIDGRFYTDEYIDRLVKRIYELEEKIDRAIEYISNNDLLFELLQNEKVKNELLDILRGKDNE